MVAGLVVALGTRALVAALCVDALVLAYVLPSGALVQIHTADPVRAQRVPGRTGTREAALCVLTRELTWRRLLLTLVYVWNQQMTI